MKINSQTARVLAELELSARDSCTDIAKRTKMSEQLVQYHLRRAEDLGLLLGYMALIDLALIGYQTHLIYFRFFGLSSQEERAWFEKTRKSRNVILLVGNIGRWDATLAVLAKDQSDLVSLLSKLNAPIAGKISEMNITTQTECYYCSTNLLAKHTTKLVATRKPIVRVEIDEIDQKLLVALADNCRTPMTTLGEMVGLSGPAIQKRIMNLEKENVIAGYKAKIDYELAGFLQFRILLKLTDTSIEMFNKIKSEVISTGVVESVSRYIGYSDFDFRCHARNLTEFSRLLTRIRDKFVHEIMQVEVHPIFGWRSVNYMPLYDT